MPGDFDRLTKPSMWRNVLYIAGGFVAPEVVRRLLENNVDTDLPDEVYGLLVAGAAAKFGTGAMRTYGMSGAGFYVVAKLLERFDLIDPIVIQQAGA